MSKYIKILTNDRRFSRMLTLELERVNISEVESFIDIKPTDELFVAADLDFCKEEELKNLPYDTATVIGFYKNESSDTSDKTSLCSKVFHRPFLISELIAFLGGEEDSVKKSQRKPKNQEFHKKTHILTIDHKNKLALWGENKIALSEYEYKVLSLLCESRGNVVPREAIQEAVGAIDGKMGDVYICHLRRKIDNKLGLKLIYTIRGKGYMLKN